MLLFGTLTLVARKSPQADNTHLQSPDSSDPHLELPLHAVDVVELYALPPTSPGRLPPEQQQLLCHAHSVVAHFVTTDVTAKPCEGKTADDGLVRLAGAVSPLVVVIKTTVSCCQLNALARNAGRR